jgi:undecaprenyl-diphosphatase
MDSGTQAVADDPVEGLWLAAILLGLLEGLTEFIPVSSTGHLLLAVEFFGVNTPPGQVFEIVIQFGAILAVCVAYWSRLWTKAVRFFSDPAARRFVTGILAAFAPAVVLGLVASDIVKELFFNATTIAIALILGGLVMILVERYHLPIKFRDAEDIDPITALKIGVIQCAAFIPGVSRSGATIVGARLLGVEAKSAAEFSFFVAIPTIFGASAYDLYKARDSLNADGATMIAIGFVVSFISALVIIKPFLAFVAKRGLLPFAYYRIVLGIVILALLAFGLGQPKA